MKPIFGLPILEVDRSHTVKVIKRSMKPGSAGIDNEPYYIDRTQMLVVDAKSFVSDICERVAGRCSRMTPANLPTPT